MPITQIRMVRVIRAADLFKNSIIAAKNFVSEQCSGLGPDCTREETLAALQAIQFYFVNLSLPLGELENLAAERAHFAQNAVRNNRQANRERTKRAPAGTVARSTAPDTMDKTRSEWTALALDRIIPKPSAQGAEGLNMANVMRSANQPPASKPEDEKTLAEHKLDYNRIAGQFNMPIPYPDPYDDSQPLLPDWGGQVGEDADSDSIF